MPAFDYAALDARGRSRSGVISADSAEQARSAQSLNGLALPSIAV